MWERLSFGNGGWVAFESSELEARVYVRFEDRDGRLAAVDLFVADEGGALARSTANFLRRVPWGRIEAWAQSEEDLMRKLMNLPGPDLRRAAAHYSTTFGHADHWVAQMLYAQVRGSGVPQAPMPRRKKPPQMPPPPNPKLEVPPFKPYGDDFYRQVAQVYSALSRDYRAPAGVLADANGVPVTTVHRWVKQARARGFLPPGHPGKAG